MKFIYFNPETQMGYVLDEMSPEEAEAIAAGIGLYMVMNLVAALITAIIIFPFFIVSGLDKFLISFCSINKNFIIGTAIVLILIKFLTKKLSRSLIVRFLFALMIMVPVLYLLLYRFHMADLTISIGKRLEFSQFFLKDTTVQAFWFESILQNIYTALSKFYFHIYNGAISIDFSPFSASLSTINIVSILICVGKFLFWWGLLLLFSLVLFVVGLISIIILVGLPYFIAFGVLIFANNLIYNIKLKYVKYLKF